MYQTLRWKVVSLSLRDVMEGAIGVKDFSNILACFDSKQNPLF